MATARECDQRLTGGARLAVHAATTRQPPMFKITRSTEDGTTTLALSGRAGSEHLADLRRFLDEARGQSLVVDLGEVTLVDVDVVRFLIECETRAIRLTRCPGYVHEWMIREKRA